MNLFHPDTATVLYILAAIVIPFVTSLVSSQHWDGAVQGAITMVLAAVDGFVTTWAQSSSVNHYDWQTAVSASVLALALAFVSRNVTLRGTKLDAKLLAVGSKNA